MNTLFQLLIPAQRQLEEGDENNCIEQLDNATKGQHGLPH